MLKKSKLVKEEHQSTNFGLKVDEYQAIQSSLDEVRKEKYKIEQELKNLRSINMQREELKVENENLENLKREMVEAKKGEVSGKIKLGAVAVEALIDPKGKMKKCKFDANVERVNPDMKGDVVEVVLKGTKQAVEKTDKLLRELTSSYSVLPLKVSQHSVLTAGECLLEQIRWRASAAIGCKDGTFYIFGSERGRLETKAVIKQELKLYTSSSWRRWSFLRKRGGKGGTSKIALRYAFQREQAPPAVLATSAARRSSIVGQTNCIPKFEAWPDDETSPTEEITVCQRGKTVWLGGVKITSGTELELPRLDKMARF